MSTTEPQPAADAGRSTTDARLPTTDSGLPTTDSRLLTISVPLQSRRARRAKTVQKLQHAIPAFALLANGLNLLSEQPHGFALGLGISEVVVSAVLIVVMARSVRAVTRKKGTGPGEHSDRDRSPSHHGVDWVDIWTSAMLFTESAERYHLHHKLLRPSLLTAIGLLALGLMHGRVLTFAERRRALRLTEDEVYVGGKPFRSWRAKWGQIAGVTIGDRFADIRTRDGRQRRIDLADLINADEVKDALVEMQRRLGTT
jgi:hypothetical protein